MPMCAVRKGHGNVIWGGPLGTPNIPTRKHKCLYEQLVTHISTQKAVNVNHPYTDGSNALRVATSTYPVPYDSLPKAPVKLLSKNDWTPSVDSQNRHVFFSSNLIHPSTPDSLILWQDNHNLRERFLTNLPRPIYPLWNLYTSKYHFRLQTLRWCLMSKAS